MKRVLLLSDSFNGYGAERMLLWLGNQLSTSHTVTFCSGYDNCANKGMKDCTNFFSLGLHKKKHFLTRIVIYYILGFHVLMRHHQKDHFNIVITFQTRPFLLALFFSWFTGVRLIHSERDDPYNRKSFAGKFKMWLFQYADTIIFQTQGAMEFFPDVVRKKGIIIPNAVKPSSYKWSIKTSQKTIANVGRLDIFYKRQDIMIKAFADVVKTHPEYNLNIYGDGADRAYLEDLVESLGLKEKVTFFGKVNNVVERLSKDGIFVLSSDTEGLPNVLLEALSIGIPSISTDCSPGGARFILNDNEYGLIVPRGNVKELSRAIMKMIDDKKLQLIYSNKANEIISRFSEGYISKAWEKVINS